MGNQFSKNFGHYHKKVKKEKKINKNKKFMINIYIYNPIKEMWRSFLHQESFDDFSFDRKEYQLEATLNTPFIDIKNQIENNYQISFKEYSIYAFGNDLKNYYDDKLLDSIFSSNENNYLYLYPKKELYEITVNENKSYESYDIQLRIHDSMKMIFILLMLYERSNEVWPSKSIDKIMVNNIKANLDKTALFYNLRKNNTIIYDHSALLG